MGYPGRLSDPSDGIRSRGHIVGMGHGDSKQPQQSQKKKRVSERTLIENVQKKLAQKGYSPGPADGVLGGNTINAIRSFQRDNSLSVNGILTSKTIDILGLEVFDTFSFVRDIQISLRERNCYNGPVDGKPNEKLFRTVREFGKDNNLPIGSGTGIKRTTSKSLGLNTDKYVIKNYSQ